MKSAFFTLLLTLLALGATAQKVVVKDGLMTVDRQPYARFESDGGNALYISSPQNERLFVVKEMWSSDQLLPGTTHPVRGAHYLQYVFTASRLVVETPFPSSEVYFRSIAVARQIYAARLLQNGALDPKAVADFLTNNGTQYSDLQRQLAPALSVPAGK
ncbi:hypothetical protein [Hymenobacter arcticus]